MSHGETMAKLGRIIALQEVMIHMQDEINSLNKQIKEDEQLKEDQDGSN